MKFAFLVKIYQNRSDVMTRRACTVWIINNLLSIMVKWLQKIGVVYVERIDFEPPKLAERTYASVVKNGMQDRKHP